MKPLNKIKIKWSPKFAYAIGLITTDGNLSKDGRHVIFTSKDLQLVKLFSKCLNLNLKIGRKNNGTVKGKSCFYVQFGNVVFYRFLQDIGLTPKKSKTIGRVKIPVKYFFDFLRGHFDGDGSFYSYWDPRWRSSFMYYTSFVSASRLHIKWLQNRLKSYLGIIGHITKSDNQPCYQLKYAKSESRKLLSKIYYQRSKVCLVRKYLKIQRALGIIDRHI